MVQQRRQTLTVMSSTPRQSFSLRRDYSKLQTPSTQDFTSRRLDTGESMAHICNIWKDLFEESSWTVKSYGIAELQVCVDLPLRTCQCYDQHSLVQPANAMWATGSFLRDSCSLLLQNFQILDTVCSSSPCCDEL